VQQRPPCLDYSKRPISWHHARPWVVMKRGPNVGMHAVNCSWLSNLCKDVCSSAHINIATTPLHEHMSSSSQRTTARLRLWLIQISVTERQARTVVILTHAHKRLTSQLDVQLPHRSSWGSVIIWGLTAAHAHTPGLSQKPADGHSWSQCVHAHLFKEEFLLWFCSFTRFRPCPHPQPTMTQEGRVWSHCELSCEVVSLAGQRAIAVTRSSYRPGPGKTQACTPTKHPCNKPASANTCTIEQQSRKYVGVCLVHVRASHTSRTPRGQGATARLVPFMPFIRILPWSAFWDDS